ncbi:hypothetical protein A3F27_01940 [Candidatus Kaiserbacteria bacterium RIFCSPHIGHO2_12_FULL_53_13]|uniref:Aminotransferase class V domain-containing protein n=1 Tax=Candidatus Kaiserbacteria bacterium RIFCSPHIGHO2_12_FULL_53_13 TaxID=1798502 RepID=A0A1F6EBU2_9BACT|nr:MAG: hypothetical protein A3F27_01940 [Candidatus Kaiserbacteria bacterium RIFCSPHIGHO2_12_FULL_53_13]
MGFFGTRRIYLDYASATPVSAQALRAMREAERLVGNPSSIHSEGVEAKHALENSRSKIAAELACKAREIIFTSGITESNNLAILGCARKRELSPAGMTGTHWIVSSIEHASVLECFNEIERMGGAVSHVDPDSHGVISPDAVARSLCSGTVFVSIGWTNNELGVVQPLSAIKQVLREHEEKHGTSIIFHTDAGQGPLYRPLQVHTLGVDLLALGSAKLYGPHGIGCLYVSNRSPVASLILGGGQERGLRAGTESVALTAGFAEALMQIGCERDGEAKRLAKLRNMLAERLAEGIHGLVINGDLKRALPHMLNISIQDIRSEYFMLALDRAGIAVSTKSACNEGEMSRSHVVLRLAEAAAKEVGETHAQAWRSENTLRFSLGRATSARDIKRVSDECIAITNRMKSS